MVHHKVYLTIPTIPRDRRTR